MPDSSLDCPCGSNKQYKACCGPIHSNIELALTAEMLMRSRYTAFALKNEDYLLASWHPETRPESIPFEDDTKWIGLKIKASNQGSINDISGTVQFLARYKIAGKAYRLEENSQFFKINDRWLYHSAI